MFTSTSTKPLRIRLLRFLLRHSGIQMYVIGVPGYAWSGDRDDEPKAYYAEWLHEIPADYDAAA
jgi:hypothetical protein